MKKKVQKIHYIAFCSDRRSFAKSDNRSNTIVRSVEGAEDYNFENEKNMEGAWS